MIAIWDLRLNSKYAHLVVRDDEGELLGIAGSVRRVCLSLNDPRLENIRRIKQRVREQFNDHLYWGTGCALLWKYDRSELDRAQLFCLDLAPPFEPCGEECGTQYDESRMCVHCGDGRKQTSELCLDLRKIPKSRDISSTLADEWVVSQRLAEILVEQKITGFQLAPARHKARYEDDPLDLTEVPAGRKLLLEATEQGLSEQSWAFWVWLNRPENQAQVAIARQENAARKRLKAQRCRKPPPVWYQLIVTGSAGHTAPPTRFGIDPITDDEDGKYRCPLGHSSGHNLLSEVFVQRHNWDGTDMAVTSDKWGYRMGVLVPNRILLISPRLFWLLKEHRIRAFKYSIAHFVD